MRTENGYMVFNKNENTQLSTHFNSDELQCQCRYDDCVEQRVSEELVGKLEDVRNRHGASVSITSGFRCHQHQLDLGAAGAETAKGLSQHELGNASDIKALDMDQLLKDAEPSFMAVGVSKSFLHCDTRSDKIRRWTYQN